jgi:hypothetical protein
MTDVRESIVADIVTTLQGITEDNGYNCTVETVSRQQILLPKLSAGLTPAVFVGDPRVTPELRSNDYHGFLMEIILRGIWRARNAESKMHYLAHDILTALMVDPHRGLDAVGFTEVIDVTGSEERNCGIVDITLNIYWTEEIP